MTSDPQKPSRNLFVFVIWAKARKFEPQIREALAREFTIVHEEEIRWPWWGFTKKLFEFYKFGGRFIWWNKARKCGRGPFKVIVIEDPSPVWKEATDTRGQHLIVDERVYTLKKAMRRLTGHSNIVHSSVTREETAEQLAVLCQDSKLLKNLV